MTCSLSVRYPLVSYTKGTHHLVTSPLLSYIQGTHHLVTIPLVSYTKGTRHLVILPSGIQKGESPNDVFP
jgi:hypothetical protein